MRVRSLFLAASLACTGLAVTPAIGEANSLYFKSSMNARCLGTDCRQVQFTLSVDGNFFVDWVNLVSHDQNRWQFAGLVDVRDADGNPLDWQIEVSSDSIWMKTGGYLAPEPITITVEMRTFTDQLELHDRTIAYYGLGNVSPDYSGSQAVFGDEVVTFEGGTVTPEPLSLVLLGTGLAGVAGVHRRRKRRDDGSD